MSAACRLEGVSKRYGRHQAVRDVSAAIRPGQILGLVGPNGAGKTTLLRIAAGLLRPTKGTVRWDAIDRNAVRYFAGERTLPPHVPAERWVNLWGRPNPARTSERRRLGVLSRGTRQRIGLEATMSGPAPKLLLLDEPWEGLDPDASRWLSRELQERRDQGTALWVSSHRIHELAEICEACAFLVRGRLVWPPVANLDGVSAAERAVRLFEAFDAACGERG